MTTPSTKRQPGAFRKSRLPSNIGVEVGFNSIHMVRTRTGSDGVPVFEGCRTTSYDPLLELDSSAFASVLKSALKEFCGSPREVSLWASPKQDRARVYHVQVPRMTPSRLPGAVYWALKREEPFLDEETVMDFETDGRPSSPTEPNLRVTGLLAVREDVEGIQRAFSQAGYPLAGVALPLYGLRNLVTARTGQSPQAPAVLCQVGLNNTSVSVLLGTNLVFTRSIPVGLKSLADALIKELDPAPNAVQAGTLVLGLGQGEKAAETEGQWREDEVFSIIRPGLERMVRQIERTLQYYQSNYNSDPIENIYLGGEIAARGRVCRFIAGQINANLIPLDPFDTPRLRSHIRMPEAPAERLAYGPAFGLSLSEPGRTPNLARTYKDRQDESKRRKVASAVFAVFVLLCAAAGLFYGWQQTQLHALEEERAELAQSLEATGPMLTEAVIMAAMQDVRAQQERLRTAAIKVGLAVSDEPPRRSRRAVFSHRAPLNGRAVEAARRWSTV